MMLSFLLSFLAHQKVSMSSTEIFIQSFVHLYKLFLILILVALFKLGRQCWCFSACTCINCSSHSSSVDKLLIFPSFQWHEVVHILLARPKVTYVFRFN
jgi:hypothetical protein